MENAQCAVVRSIVQNSVNGAEVDKSMKCAVMYHRQCLARCIVLEIKIFCPEVGERKNMKIQEAINVMEKYTDATISKVVAEAHRMAIEALEKQIPKQVGYICGVCGEKYECPECGSGLTDTDLFAGHCRWCGQAIKDN